MKKPSAIHTLLSTALVMTGLHFSASAMAQEPIRIGSVLSTTGPAAFLGDPEEKTLKLYVDRINADGGVLGRKLELVIYDDGSDANKSNSFAKRVVLQDKVDIIVGGSTTGTTMSMLPQVEGSKTPFFSMGAASVIVEPVRPYTFKLPHSDRLAAQKVLQDMKKRGITKFALLSDTGGFGKGGHTETLKAAQAMGMTISVDQNYGEKDTDITPQLTKVKSSDAQAIFVFGTGQAPAIVAKNYQQLGLKVPLYMSHGQASMEFVKLSGDAAEGIRMPSPALLVAEQLADGDPQKKIGVDYKNTYEKQYKTDVSTFGGYAYDGLMMSIAAFKQVGSTDKKKVRDAIEGMKNFPGVNGVYNMSATDHNGLDDKSFVMTEIRKGQFKKID